jgi:Fur family ferric uptake transcriptional regulator
MNTTTKDLLKEFDLRTTSCRTEILSLFLNNNYALSHSDIEHTLSDAHDRVTVYRTLKTFLDKGIIHKVLDDGGSAKYAICKDSCSIEDHNHEHVHFKCLKCGMTNCLENVEVPKFNLPSGYNAVETYLLVQGICSICS